MFSEKKAEVDDIHMYLLLKGVQAVSIHGGKGEYRVLTRPHNCTALCVTSQISEEIDSICLACKLTSHFSEV